MADGGFVSGFVAICGRPNVGKSTLLNQLLGRKLAIVSSRPQTTRNRILGVLDLPGAQVALLDTPGLHRPRHRLGEYMVRVALAALKQVDLVLWLVEGLRPPGPGDRYVAGLLRPLGPRVLLVVNKIDLVPAAVVPGVVAEYAALGSFGGALAVSALCGAGLDELLREVVRRLPSGPRYYPEGTVTDRPEEFVVAELIREQALLLTHHEVPHAVAVVVEEISARPGGRVYVRATVYVEKESQKGILIGRGGLRLKELGQRARAEIEALLGSPVYLDLWVKVKRDWRQDVHAIEALGYRE
ncbi:MAG: GTPase Era [Acetobacteraceae bacterium]|nr:GTPase Era [Acetobacteraceae bacterium]